MWWLQSILRRWVRSTMKPMAPEKAQKWLFRMRVGYFVSGFAFMTGTFIFIYYPNRKDFNKVAGLDQTNIHRQARVRGQTGKVVGYSIGFGGIDRVEFDGSKNLEEYERRKEEFVQKKKAEMLPENVVTDKEELRA